jgi:hypothetical protein
MGMMASLISGVRGARIAVTARAVSTGVLSLLAGVGCALALGAAPAWAESCPNASLRSGVSAGLPDCRAYELVSPLEKNGFNAGARPAPGAEQQSTFVQYARAATDGSSLFYGEDAGVTNNYGADENPLQYYSRSTRSAGGWETRGVLPVPNQLVHTAGNVSDVLPSQDLSQIALGAGGMSFGAAPDEALDLFGSDGSVTWLSQPAISDPVISNEAPLIVGASEDLSRIYFTYNGTLLPSDVAASRGGAGFYEWTRSGGLSYAGVLPDGSVDPRGAMPAALELAVDDGFHFPGIFSANDVSSDGSRAFFQSPPPPGGEPGDTPELYVRETAPDGSQRTVLVSGSALTGQPAVDSPLSGGGTASAGGGFMFASADGSHVFFEDIDALTAAAPNDDSIKEYDFDTLTNTLSYLPGFADQGKSPILTSSPDGSRVLFFKETSTGNSLDLWSGGQIVPVAQYPGTLEEESAVRSLPEGRVSADSSVFVFETNVPIYSQSPGQFNNGGGFMQIYRYAVSSGQLSCLSCGPPSLRHTGNAELSHYFHYDEAVSDNRGISSDGSRVFFDTPDALVPQDTNGKRDVYEWEADGSGSCGEAAGCLYLISSGQSAQDSFFLDNSASGEDVFFATTQGLDPQDIDGSYDIYDARVGGGFPAPSVPSSCSEEACQGAPSAPPSLPSPASVVFSGPGDAAPGGGGPPATTAAVKARGGVVHGSVFLLAVEVPGAGRVTVSGGGVKTAAQSLAAAGSYHVRVALTAGERRALKRKHKLKLALRVAYAPTGGQASSVTVSITDKA